MSGGVRGSGDMETEEGGVAGAAGAAGAGDMETEEGGAQEQQEQEIRRLRGEGTVTGCGAGH